MDQQLGLPMLTVYQGPRLVDSELVLACKTYRQAVRACWDIGKRARPGYTQRQLAEDIGCYPCHITDYLAQDEKSSRRDLPAKKVNDFELEMGNRLVSQWLAWRSGLPVLDAGFMAHLEKMRRVA
jgi:hypothetical protein